MYKTEKRTCKACKTTVLHCKYAKFVTILSPSLPRLLKPTIWLLIPAKLEIVRGRVDKIPLLLWTIDQEYTGEKRAKHNVWEDSFLSYLLASLAGYGCRYQHGDMVAFLACARWWPCYWAIIGDSVSQRYFYPFFQVCPNIDPSHRHPHRKTLHGRVLLIRVIN